MYLLLLLSLLLEACAFIDFSGYVESIKKGIISVPDFTNNPIYSYIYGIDASKLHYELYTQKHSRNPVLLTNSTFSELNVKLKTKIIISGYMTKHNSEWVIQLKETYLNKSNYNIILFDWDQYSQRNYLLAQDTTTKCGNVLGSTLAQLMNVKKLNISNVHIIGHSLGAQIAGYAGKQIISLTGTRIGRISALDAAGPIFQLLPTEERINSDDAEFVDGYHTNSYVFGLAAPYGTVDFYIEGGIVQPECISIKNVTEMLIVSRDVVKFVSCSHSFAQDIFIQSITTNLKATNLEKDKVSIGEKCPRTAEGHYSFVRK